MKNQYGYIVYYKQRGSEKLKIYLVTNTYGSAEWNVRWYENHSPPDRKTGKPIENATWIIRPITTYREYKRRWRGCPFEPLFPKNKKITRRKQMKISIDKLYYLCNKYQWYTNGDSFQSNLMFQECKNGAPLERLATFIYVCSRGYSEQDILKILQQEADIK